MVRARPSSIASHSIVRAAVGVLLVAYAAQPLSAQTVEIAPFAGYRFGGDLFELAANRPLDLDGAPVVGATVNVAIYPGLWFEALATHQQATAAAPGDAYGPPAQWRVSVDHWLAGGRQELGSGRVRPFVTGLLGLTRYGAADDNEIRFAVSAGGGMKLALQRRLGLRLDGRVFTTLVNLDARAGACGAGVCVFGLNANVAWQAEFTADLVVGF